MKKTLEEFDIIYNNLHEKYFNQYEKMRIQDKKNNYKGIIGLVLIFLAMPAINVYLDDKDATYLLYFGIIVGIIGAILIYLCFSKKGTDYEKRYKEEVITEFLNRTFPEVKYYSDIDGEDKNKLIESYKNAKFDLIDFDTWYSEDFMIGATKELKFKIFEFSAEQEYIDSNKEKRYRPIFSGICTDIKLNYNKNVDIKILSRNKNTRKEQETVMLDNNDFNSKFITISNSDVEAYQILTSDVILFLNKQIENMDFDISIKNDEIFMRFYTLPIFEAGSNGPVMKKESFYRYFEVLNFIIDFSNKINNIYKDANF